MSFITIPSYKFFDFLEVFEVTAWKDGCVYETKTVGFIHNLDKPQFPPTKYVLAPLSTKLTNTDEPITLEPFIGERRT